MKGKIALASVLVASLLLALSPTVRAANPSLIQSNGAASSSVTTLSVALSLHAAGDTVVVVEQSSNGQCSSNQLLTPTDSGNNIYVTSLGCVSYNANLESMKPFYVLSSSGAGSLTVTCHFAANTAVESCYAFDLQTVGVIGEPATNTGTGTSLSVASFTPMTNSLILALAGISANCAAVTVGAGFTALSPTSECSLGYGMSGQYEAAFSGSTTAPMSIGVSSNWAELVVEVDLVSQPITATFTGNTGGQQTVTLSGCGVNPTSILGDGISHTVTASGSCTLTLTLPATYAWVSTGTSTRTLATCATLTCAGVSDTYSYQHVVMVQVAACTWFQMQCWLYPVFFLSVYVLLLGGVAWWSEIPDKDYLGIVLEGLSIGSLIGVVIGMINITIPMIITAVQVVRAMRG